jgi:PAS domain S-box-containing protein
MKHNIELKDLIDKAMLEELLLSFSELTGLAVVAFDKEKTFTKEINFNDFCMKYTRGSKKGLAKCLECDFSNAETAIATGKPAIYKCHSGLYDLAVPIMLEDEMIGSILCGQVLTEEPDFEHFKKIAKEYEINEDEYIEAVKKVQIISEEKIKAAASMLFNLAKSLSNLAQKNYELRLNNKKQKLVSLIVESINSTFNIEEILNTICTKVADVFEIEKVFVAEFQNGKIKKLKEYKTNDAYGKYKEKYGQETYSKAIEFITKELVENKSKTITWFDRNLLDTVPEYLKEICIEENIYSIVSANIHNDQNSFTELLLESHNPDKSWSKEDKEFLIMLTKQISIAFRQAKLYNELQQLHKRESSILNNFPYATWLKETSGKFLAANKSLLEQLNLDYKTIINKYDYDLFDKTFYDKIREEDDIVIRTQKPLTKTDERVVDGEKKCFMVYKTPVFDEKGNVWAIAGFRRDVTAEKEIEKFKSEFVSIVSHELRTPLTSIIGAIGLMNSKTFGELPVKYCTLLDVAQNNSQRLLTLINDILDVEKIDAGKMAFNMQNLDFQQTVNEAVESMKDYADKYQVKIELKDKVNSITVKADKDRLIQVLHNLLSNAVKYTRDAKEVEINCYTKDGNVFFSITNFGYEIPAELSDNLFKKFYQINSTNTRSKGGTGLGLHIAKNLIEEMGGNINFISKDNSTTFNIKLPIVKL